MLAQDGGISVARPGPRHPGRHRAADQAVRRRGGVHQAARRRQVRRRLLQRHRRSARRRLLGGQRAVQPAGRRGRPRRRHLRRCRSGAAPPGCSTATARRPPFTPGSGLRKVGRARKGVTGTRVRYWPDRQIFLKDAQLRWRSSTTGPGRPASWCPGWRWWSPTPADREPTERDVPARGRDRGVLRVPGARRAGHRGAPAAGPGPVHRDRADAGRRRPHDADRRRARSRRRHRGALGQRATTPPPARS